MIAVLAAGGAVAAALASREAAKAAPAQVRPEARRAFIAAAGRVEPLGEEVKISAEMNGKLAQVLVEEGDRVKRGQTIAVLSSGDYVAWVGLAEAAVREREAQEERLLNGARDEEKREAEALLREAEAQLAVARAERERRQGLLERGAVSRSEYDLSSRDHDMARARVEAQRERLNVARAQTRVEDLKRAEAEVADARAALDEARAMLEKTIIRAPLDGRVLRRYRKSGETVSGKGDTPIVSVGEVGTLRVRVDVDEVDVAKLKLGQAAWVTAGAYGDHRFTGRVVRIGQALGRKNVRTDEPSERVDTKILETLVELDAGQQLPVGLRVDAFLEVSK